MTSGNRLTDMEFDEISLVNRPANQLSKVVLFKNYEEPLSMSDSIEKGTGTRRKNGEISKPGYKKGHSSVAPSEDEEDEELDEAVARKKGKGYMKKDDEGSVDLPAEVYEYIESLESANAEMVDELEKVAQWVEEDEDIMKAADPAIVEIVKAAEERAEAAELIAKAERDFRLEREFIAKAGELDNLSVDPEAFGRVLKSAADTLDSEIFSAIAAVLQSANEMVGQGGLFEEVGKSTSFDNDEPMAQIEKAAARLIDADPEMTKAQAIAKAVDIDPTLYNSYVRGN